MSITRVNRLLYKSLLRTCKKHDTLIPRSKSVYGVPLVPLLRARARETKKATLKDLQTGFAELRQLRYSFESSQRWVSILNKPNPTLESGLFALASISNPKLSHDQLQLRLEQLLEQIRIQYDLEVSLSSHVTNSNKSTSDSNNTTNTTTATTTTTTNNTTNNEEDANNSKSSTSTSTSTTSNDSDLNTVALLVRSVLVVFDKLGFQVKYHLQDIDDHMIDKFLIRKSGSYSMWSLMIKIAADRFKVPVDLAVFNDSVFVFYEDKNGLLYFLNHYFQWIPSKPGQRNPKVSHALLYQHLTQFFKDWNKQSKSSILWNYEEKALTPFIRQVELKEVEKEEEKKEETNEVHERNEQQL